jgi:hypothetical protein
MAETLILFGVALVVCGLTLLYAAGIIGPKEVDKTAQIIAEDRKYVEELKKRLGIGGNHEQRKGNGKGT